MSFDKKVLILKELEKGYSVGGKPISGIIKIEGENNAFTVYSSIINTANANNVEYFLFVIGENAEVFSFPLGSRPDFFTKTIDGNLSIENLSVGLVAVENYIPLTVAFASNNKSGDALSSFNREVINFFSAKLSAEKQAEEEKKVKIEQNTPEETLTEENFPEENLPEESPIKPPYPPAPCPDPTVTPPEEFPSGDDTHTAYNDEAVATDNYFALEEQLTSKLDKLKEFELSIDQEIISSEQTKEKNYSTNNRYFDTVCGELEQIFLKFPEEKQLKKTFAKSRWAKVYYSDTKYYVVGVIKESNKEKYICYGVPATYSKTPPKELEGVCTFIPLSIFSLLGDGYWMMFQDAVTGECIKPK